MRFGQFVASMTVLGSLVVASDEKYDKCQMSHQPGQLRRNLTNLSNRHSSSKEHFDKNQLMWAKGAFAVKLHPLRLKKRNVEADNAVTHSTEENPNCETSAYIGPKTEVFLVIILSILLVLLMILSFVMCFYFTNCKKRKAECSQTEPKCDALEPIPERPQSSAASHCTGKVNEDMGGELEDVDSDHGKNSDEDLLLLGKPKCFTSS